MSEGPFVRIQPSYASLSNNVSLRTQLDLGDRPRTTRTELQLEKSLYVAATRAREAMIVYADDREKAGLIAARPEPLGFSGPF